MIRYIQTLILTLVAYSMGLGQNHPPQPICQPLISTLPYNSDTLKVPARFFNNGSYDLETPPELLRYSYSTNPEDSIRIYTCGSPGPNFLEVYVFDEEDEYEYCTEVLFLDHHYCDTMSTSLTDTLSPILFVYNKTIPTLPDSNFLMCVTAKDFVIHGYDNGEINDSEVNFSFSTNEEDTMQCFSCLDVGEYQIAIYGTDLVGNQIHVPLLLSVVANAGCDQTLDTMRPIAICEEGLTFSIDSSKRTVVYPDDLDGGSYDNVTEADDLWFYFQEVWEDSIVFTCDQLGDHLISIFVSDESFNASLCSTDIVIDDPYNFCNISSTSNIHTSQIFTLYPNPGRGFNLKYDSKLMRKTGMLKVFNSLGELVYTKISSELDEFIIPDIPPGMYSIILQTEDAKNYQFKWLSFSSK